MKGKDLMKGTYTYTELAEAYDNFLGPAVALYVNGESDNIIQTKGLAVESIQVTLSVEGAAGLSLQLSDVLEADDAGNKSIKGDIRTSFQVGTVLEAAMGYGSDLTSVFKGYVTEFQTSYQSTPSVSVTAVDFRKLLMGNRRENYAYTEKTYSVILKEVLSNYSNLYSELHIDDQEGEVTIFQNGTDFEFIKDELCFLAGREFFVVGAHVYFIEPQESENGATAFLKLDWGKNLISFQKGRSYCKETVKVYSGQGDKTGSEVSGKVSTSDDTPSLTSEELTEEYYAGESIDDATLQSMLKKMIAQKKKRNVTAQGTLPGLPEIVPGRYLQIGGVDEADGGTFYLSEVRHSFGGDGFTTTFIAGVKKDRLTGEGQSDLQKSARSFGRGLMRAVVKQNWDENNPGKVLVEFRTGAEGKKTTDWLPVLRPYCGSGYGFYFLPEIDSEVLVGALSGDDNSLVVLGGLWNDVDQPPAETAVEKNNIKRIRTKGEHEIVFDDDEESAKIKICTKQKLCIELNDKEQRISIADDKGENGVEVNVKEGTLKLFAKEKLTLAAGKKDAVVIEGGDKVTVKSGQIIEQGTQSFQIKTQKLEVNGDMTEIKASGSMKLSSSGIAEIKGSMVKIN